jgi:PHD/YefM family antitoxin component YafN of YafNO toxin-antitoxin module
MNHVMFQKVEKAIGVSDFRATMAAHLAGAKKQPLIVSTRRGGDSFVVLSIDAYNTLVEAWEDEQDARELDRLAKLQKGKKLVPWERVKGGHV